MSTDPEIATFLPLIVILAALSLVFIALVLITIKSFKRNKNKNSNLNEKQTENAAKNVKSIDKKVDKNKVILAKKTIKELDEISLNSMTSEVLYDKKVHKLPTVNQKR
jgi:hypothetical protein